MLEIMEHRKTIGLVGGVIVEKIKIIIRDTCEDGIAKKDAMGLIVRELDGLVAASKVGILLVHLMRALK